MKIKIPILTSYIEKIPSQSNKTKYNKSKLKRNSLTLNLT